MKNKMNDILIRNVDASYLYWKIKDDKKIKEYEEIKSKLSENDSTENEDKLKQLSEEIFSFKPNIELDKKDNRYLYSGTITDSLMSRKLRSLVSDSDGAIRTVGQTDKEPGTDYTDLIINLKFKSDIMIITDENKKKYNPDTDEIEETDSKKSKRLISKKKLRKMAYRDGITINGIHYVDFQRTSSKARTGNCLFIDDRYIKAMEEWQTMGIPFRAIVKTEDKENPFEMIDIVIENNSLRVATGVLNEIVAEAVAMQQPPTDKGKRLKIYYITQAAVKPPTFVIFVNDKELMHFSYTRYLENRIRDTFGFRGTALKFIIRERKEEKK